MAGRAVACVAAWRPPTRDALLGLGLAAAAVASRAAVRARSLTTFDAGLHANAIVRYDVPSGQPHPPGYPLGVLAGRVVDAAVHDPVAAMVWLSILWTAGTVVLLWRFGERLGGRGAGLAAAGLFLLSPLALFNGSVGLTYAADAFTSTLVAWAAWRAGERPDRNRLLALGLALAFAVGVRPSALLFLAPLGLWPALRPGARKERAVRVGWVAAAAVPACLAWLLPMLAFGGGLAAIRSANAVQSRTVVFPDTVFTDGWGIVPGHLGHLAGFAHAELLALPWILGGIVVAAALAGRAGLDLLRRHRARAGFAALWTLPALLFYTFVYVGWPVFPPGYLMVVLPPLLLGLAAVAVRLAAAVPQPRRRAVAVAALLALLFVPLSFAPAAWREATRPTRDADAWAASWDGLEEAFPPGSTAIVMTESWQHVKLRDPEYVAFVRARYDHADDETYTRGIVSHGGVDSPRWFELLAMDPDDAPVHAIPAGVTRIVLHEGHPSTGPETLVKPEVTLHETVIASGRGVRWFEPDPAWRAIESYFPDVDPAWSEARLAAQEGRP